MYFRYSFLLISVIISGVAYGAVLSDDSEVEEQGLYSKSDHVEILTHRNFDRKVYGQKHALVIQFYNSFCGHCRSFAPKFKTLANDVRNWKNIVRLAVVDCSVEENNEICRQFEVMAYPSLRYMNEQFVKSNANLGEKLHVTDTANKFKNQLIHKLQSEQSLGRLRFAPSLKIESYSNFAMSLIDVPRNNIYTILVFENDNSTVGSQLALDINNYENIRVKRVYDTSELALIAGVQIFPGFVAVNHNLESTLIVPREQTQKSILKAVNLFLKSKNYAFPSEIGNSIDIDKPEHSDEISQLANSDVVYYSDLEKTLKTSLHTEITRYRTLTGQPLQALLDYLDVLIISFPSKGNLKEYLVALRSRLATRKSWGGSEVYNVVKQLESVHAPVYTSDLDYIGCRGSQSKYRGYSCGLWTLFHTLTVNAATKPGSEGPRVLKAMHGYVKHFFGCTDCAEHFQAMAERNRIFDVKDNDKAILWLWISHNEVNLRLAGDITEDPAFPKIQYPSLTKCPECRLARGAWNLPAVYQYLQSVYGSANIRDSKSSGSTASTFSDMDIGMLSLLMN